MDLTDALLIILTIAIIALIVSIISLIVVLKTKQPLQSYSQTVDNIVKASTPHKMARIKPKALSEFEEWLRENNNDGKANPGVGDQFFGRD